MKHWTDKLVKLNACTDAVEWAKGYRSYTAAWNACERTDWMLWLAGRICKTEAQRKRLVLTACACARTALKYVPKGEDRPRTAILTAERWARGTHGVTLDDVRHAAYAADAAYAAATAAAAADAAAYATAAYAAAAADAYAAAAYAADAAYAAAYAAAAADAYAAACAADTAAYDAADAADAAYDAAARIKALKRMAAIVRKHYPTAPGIGGE